jgi:putative membrane protein
MNPAMIASWVLGLVLVWQGGWWKAGWLHGKLLLVLALSGFHGFLSRIVREFAQDTNQRPPRFYRLINEIPTLLMISIVILVILKPF